MRPPNPSNYDCREDYEDAFERDQKAHRAKYADDSNCGDDDFPSEDRDCDYWQNVMRNY